MARIKIDIPQRTLGTFIVPVRITDLNYGNHVGNDAFVSIVHEARIQWLKGHDFTELDIDGIGLIMGDLAIEFKSESFYGDIIDVTLSVGDISKIGFELYYELNAKRNGNNILLARAKTGMICYDYDEKKIASLPQNLLSLLK
ncbi:MAG TPA: thioesterase family protein [Ferruginibacter sp.]|nr:thioesterase family protein [Ferruginibacter sp.]